MAVLHAYQFSNKPWRDIEIVSPPTLKYHPVYSESLHEIIQLVGAALPAEQRDELRRMSVERASFERTIA
jgi:hypothetical protein